MNLAADDVEGQARIASFLRGCSNWLPLAVALAGRACVVNRRAHGNRTRRLRLRLWLGNDPGRNTYAVDLGCATTPGEEKFSSKREDRS
jgi:hypothetical protein